MRNYARFATSGQHLTHQYKTTFDYEAGELSKYDNWSLQKLKEEQRNRTAKVSERKTWQNFDMSSCLGDDITQNVSSTRETQLFLA